MAGGPRYSASRRTSTFPFLIFHKFQAMDPAFQPSDYPTEAGERGYAASATTCVRPGPTVPLEDVLKVWPDRAKVAAVEDWPTLRCPHPVRARIMAEPSTRRSSIPYRSSRSCLQGSQSPAIAQP